MTIDLRSDTVTMPTAGMREAIASAPVGDDVYGDDPSVNELDRRAALITGKEAALFVSSGTQGNLIAILSHCGRGDEAIVGDQSHTYRYEGGGASVLGGVHLHTIANAEDGTLDLDDIAAAVKPSDPHFARTRLLALENTRKGIALPMRYLDEAGALAIAHGLSTHLDGARLFNAAVFDGVDASEIARNFDTVTFCLSKGLGAPVGSVLCGPAELIARARRWRKVLGGAMRQAGVLAAAGLYALDHHIERLADDHANAASLAAGLAEIEGVSVEFAERQTNMIYIRIEGRDPADLSTYLADKSIKVSPSDPTRLVTHLGVTADDVPIVRDAIASFAGLGSF